MIKLTVKKNIIANLAGRIWGVISVYIFIPIYLKFLGIEAYGLIGFYTTLIGVLSFSDFGLTSTLTREIASLAAHEKTHSKIGNLLRSYETLYLYISLAIAASVWFLAPLIAEYWLKSSHFTPNEIKYAIRIMGISIAFQLPAAFYGGGFKGIEKMINLNTLQIIYSVVRGVGLILVLWLISPTAIAFLLYCLIINFFYVLVMRYSLWRHISRLFDSAPRFSWSIFKTTWRYAIGITGIGLVSTALTQSNGLIVSKMLPLKELGYYSIAWAIAQMPLMITGPVNAAVFPRLTNYVAKGDNDLAINLYYKTSISIAAIIIPIVLTLALYSEQFIYAWTGSIITAQQTGTVATLLLLGTLMLAYQIMPFSFVLAHGVTRINFITGIISVLFIIPTLILLVHNFALNGVGISWLLLNTLVFFVNTFIIHRRYLSGQSLIKYLFKVGKPLLTVSPFLFLIYKISPHFSSRVLIMLMIGIAGAISLLISILTTKELRVEGLNILCNFWSIYNDKRK